MQEDDPESELSAFEIAQWDRIASVPNTKEFYDAYALDADSVFMELLKIIARNEIDDRGVEFLTILSRTFMHRNPNYKLTSERAPYDGAFRSAAKMLAAPIMKRMVDEIDKEVACGCKLEAAVHAAMERYDLSRREVFRCIKDIRKYRLNVLLFSKELGFRVTEFDWPLGYDVDERGRLVPTSD